MNLSLVNIHSHYLNALMLAFVLLMACSSSTQTELSSPPPPPSKPVTSVVIDTVKGSISNAWKAAQSPLEDVGLKRQPIPLTLKKITNPYAMPAPVNCPAITSEIFILDMLLGPDMAVTDDKTFSTPLQNIKMPSWRDKDKYVEQGIDQGSSMVQDKAADMARSQVSILPYRGWVRKLSGADAHAQKVAHAYEAGKLRRAFLKGISRSMNCWYIGG